MEKDLPEDFEVLTFENEINEEICMKSILINSFEIEEIVKNNPPLLNGLSLEQDSKVEHDSNQKKKGKDKAKGKGKEEEKEEKEDDKVSAWTKVKFSCANLKNQIKYNSFDLNTFKLDKADNKTVNFFNKSYTLDNPIENKKLQFLLNELMYFSYRKNFPVVVNYNTNKKYSSDCGWGCMIRSAQMLLSRALFKYFRFEKTKLHHSIMYTLFLLLDKPLKMHEIPDVYSLMIQKYLHLKIPQHQLRIRSIFPPFSIQTIIQVGQFLGKNPGEFYSDFHMAKIFSLINTHFNVIDRLSIVPVQNGLKQRDILDSCFSRQKPQGDCSEFVDYKGERYYFHKRGLFLVSIRLGLDTISASYFNSIKDIFTCNQCIGLIGGKNISAFYFIGYDKENLFYLDPHRSQDLIEDTSNYETYLKKTLHKLKIQSMQTALTAGFLILTIEDYIEMVNWIEKHEKSDFRCMSLSRTSNLEEFESTKENDF